MALPVRTADLHRKPWVFLGFSYMKSRGFMGVSLVSLEHFPETKPLDPYRHRGCRASSNPHRQLAHFSHLGEQLKWVMNLGFMALTNAYRIRLKDGA